MQQVADALLGQISAAVPVTDHGADVEAVVLADRDERAAHDERRQLAGAELSGLLIEVRGVGGQEQVALVSVEFGALMLVLGVLNRERVQTEFLTQHRQILVIGIMQVEPDDRAVLLEIVADLHDGKAFGDQVAVQVDPGPCLALGRRGLADSGGSRRLRVVTVECHPARGAHLSPPLPVRGRTGGKRTCNQQLPGQSAKRTDQVRRRRLTRE